MDHPIFLDELAANVHKQFPDYSKKEVLNRFLAWWFRGDEFPSHTDSNVEALCELTHIGKSPPEPDITGYGDVENRTFRTNRWGLVDRLTTQGYMPTNRDWRKEVRLNLGSPDKLRHIYNELAAMIEENGLVGNYLTYVGLFLIPTSYAVRFHLVTKTPLPDVLKRELRPFLRLENAQGRKTGAEIYKRHCDTAFNLLRSSGLFVPEKQNAPVAANLIASIFKFGIKPNSIEKYIREDNRDVYPDPKKVPKRP